MPARAAVELDVRCFTPKVIPELCISIHQPSGFLTRWQASMAGGRVVYFMDKPGLPDLYNLTGHLNWPGPNFPCSGIVASGKNVIAC
jgi:hypothetical protein